MAGDDVLINKSATVERCVARAREEYVHDPANFATDVTRQDAAIFNVQRACEAVLDMASTSCAERAWACHKAHATCLN